MSRSARRIRRHRTRQIEREAVRVGAAIRGCRCRPDIEHARIDGVRHVRVHHAADCPATTGPQLVIGRGHGQTAEEFARAVAAVLQALRNGGPTP